MKTNRHAGMGGVVAKASAPPGLNRLVGCCSAAVAPDGEGHIDQGFHRVCFSDIFWYSQSALNCCNFGPLKARFSCSRVFSSSFQDSGVLVESGLDDFNDWRGLLSLSRQGFDETSWWDEVFDIKSDPLGGCGSVVGLSYVAHWLFVVSWLTPTYFSIILRFIFANQMLAWLDFDNCIDSGLGKIYIAVLLGWLFHLPSLLDRLGCRSALVTNCLDRPASWRRLCCHVWTSMVAESLITGVDHGRMGLHGRKMAVKTSIM